MNKEEPWSSQCCPCEGSSSAFPMHLGHIHTQTKETESVLPPMNETEPSWSLNKRSIVRFQDG